MQACDAEGSYAEKLEIMLGCRKKAEKLHAEYTQWLSGKCKPISAPQEMDSIRHFFKESNYRADLYGVKTGKWGSTCLELAIATAFLANRQGHDARVVFRVIFPAPPLHYCVRVDKDKYEVLRKSGRRGNENRVLFERTLSPRAARMHVNVVGKPSKLVGFRLAANALHSACR